MAHAEAASIIPAGCTDVATTITVFAGDGGLFTFEAGDFSRWGTIYMPGAPGTSETVYVSDVTGDVLTIARGQQGTTAQAWGANAKIVCGISVPEYEDFDVVAGSLQYAKGPLSATDGTLPLMDGTTGRKLKASAHTPVTGGDAHTHVAGSGGALVPLTGMANLAANSIVGNNTSSPTAPLALDVSQTRTLLSVDAVLNAAQATLEQGSALTWGTVLNQFATNHADPTQILTAVCFNPATGTTVYDRWGSNNVTLSADASTFGPGYANLFRSLTFPGSTAEVSWGDVSSLTTGFTIIVCAQPSAVTTRTLLAKFNTVVGTPNREFIFSFNASGVLTLTVYGNGSTSTYITASAPAAYTETDVPHVYAAKWDGSTNPSGLSIFRDAVKLAVNSGSSGTFPGMSDTTAAMGMSFVSAGAVTGPFAGELLWVSATAEQMTDSRIKGFSYVLLGAAGRQF